MCTYAPGGASAVRQIRAAGVDLPILSTTGMSDNYWLNAVPGLKDFYVPAIMSLYGDDPRPQVNAFLQAFKVRWKEEPSSSFAILGYTTIEQWASAVQSANSTDGQAVVDVMNRFKNEPFILGPTSYSDEIHIQVDRPQLIMKVDNGGFKTVELFRNAFVPDVKLLLRAGN
jgi:branched-chain amino acid transport system substrate-binding protein